MLPFPPQALARRPLRSPEPAPEAEAEAEAVPAPVRPGQPRAQLEPPRAPSEPPRAQPERSQAPDEAQSPRAPASHSAPPRPPAPCASLDSHSSALWHARGRGGQVGQLQELHNDTRRYASAVSRRRIPATKRENKPYLRERAQPVHWHLGPSEDPEAPCPSR
eukprot:scaffold75_cov217-Pinguiococcus_pyrenoidosus.AAC.7